jgi:hypothetical protein
LRDRNACVAALQLHTQHDLPPNALHDPNALLNRVSQLLCTAGNLQQQTAPQKQQKAARRLMQYTGAVVAGSPTSYYAPMTSYSTPVGSSYNSYPAFAPNPAVGIMQTAMASGQAPSDIASVRGRGFVRGKIMGQRVDASGAAAANIGHNAYGGVTGVADANGQFLTTGRYGTLGGQGQARAAAASTRESGGGVTYLNGAAAAQASGSVWGNLPNGPGFAARGSASAQAEGQVMYYTKKK